MNKAPTPSHIQAAGPPDPLPLSALNDYLYCKRRAHLKFVDGLRGTNEHTLIGDLAHANVDTPGYEHRAGWELLRALPLFSDTLGLTGKADLVEVQRSPDDRIVAAHPVEYKKGPKRRFDNDEVQLCAQALCLEEMLGIAINDGAIYHVASARRRGIVFDAALRTQTLSALHSLRADLAQSTAPFVELRPQCDGCSLHELCLPEAASRPRPDLYHPRDYPL